jgi:sugar/nucleoside kinase (ribokinase family)
MGHLLSVKDFCKLHIIFHYAAVLLKDLMAETQIYPVGAVGDDLPAEELFTMMKNAGMNMNYVKTIPNTPTLHSICFQYPDQSGGNITESQSASSLVSAEMIFEAETIFSKNKCMVLSVPEVPLSSRLELIGLGYKYQSYVLASFVSEEIETIRKQQVLEKINLLAVNLDEAAALANVPMNNSVRDIVEGCINVAIKFNPDIRLCITCGDQGIYGYDHGELEFIPVINVPVRNTAGAGDAVLSGIITGLILGFPFIGNERRSCIKLGRLIGAMSVTSEDTINFGINLKSLKRFQKIHGEEIV